MKTTLKSIVKLMSFGFIGLALLSCSKNETPSVQEKAIGFKAYTGRAVTKANSSLIDKGSTTLNSSSVFGVYAYNTGSAAWNPNTGGSLFMKDVAVTYTSSDAPEGEQNYDPSKDPENYGYSPLRYWPNQESANKLSFFAYYPYSENDGDNGITKPTNGWGAYSFTAQTKPENMVDFCLSQVAENQTYSSTNSGTDGVVNMKFYHTLTMVRFLVKTDVDYSQNSTVVTLKSISLAAVKTTGKLTPSTTSAGWASQNDAKAFDIFPASETGLALTATEKSLPSGGAVTPATQSTPIQTPTEDAYLMIPQDLGDDVVATITYTVKTGTSTEEKEVTNIATVKLNSDANVQAWVMNKNIIYTFVVGLKPIKFIAEVADWADAQTVNIDVISTPDNSGSGSETGA